MNIFDKRRSEGWSVVFFCTPRSVIVHISTSDDFDETPQVDVAMPDFEAALKFARAVCRRTKRAVDAASAAVVEAPLTSRNFLALLAGSQPRH